MNISDMATVLPIVAICYFAGTGVKAFKLNKRFIPLITGALGGVLGVVGFFTMSSFPAQDVITAIAVGVISGLASTGFNETIKTMIKKKSADSDKTDKSKDNSGNI